MTHLLEEVRRVQQALTPDLLKAEYRTGGPSHPLAGHCYVASEALYHRLGGAEAGITPCCVRHEGTTHWFLRLPGRLVVDATADQFATPVPYDQARGTGFLTRQPSQRAQVVLRRLADA